MAKDNDNLCPIYVLAKVSAVDESMRQKSARCRETRCKWWINSESACSIKVSAVAQKTIAEAP